MDCIFLEGFIPSGKLMGPHDRVAPFILSSWTAKGRNHRGRRSPEMSELPSTISHSRLLEGRWDMQVLNRWLIHS